MTATANEPAAKPKRRRVPPIEWPQSPKILKSKTMVGDQHMTIRRRWRSKCGRYVVEHVLWWHPDLASEWVTWVLPAGSAVIVKHSEHSKKAPAFEEIARYHRQLAYQAAAHVSSQGLNSSGLPRSRKRSSR